MVMKMMAVHRHEQWGLAGPRDGPLEGPPPPRGPVPGTECRRLLRTGNTGAGRPPPKGTLYPSMVFCPSALGGQWRLGECSPGLYSRVEVFGISEGMYTLPDGVLTRHEASNSSECPWEPWYCTGAPWWYWVGTAWYWAGVLCWGPVCTRPFRRDMSPRPPPVPSPALSRPPAHTPQISHRLLSPSVAFPNSQNYGFFT